MNTFRRFSARTWLLLTGALAPTSALAGFGGNIPAIPGTPSAVDKAGVRDLILRLLSFVLDFLAIASVVFIVIAGFYLVFSQGGDEQKDKAKKIILYVILGLIVILFARVIVGFFTDTIPNEIL